MKEVTAKLFREEYQVSSEQKADHVLQKISERHEPLAVLPHDRAEEFSSALLLVNRPKHWLIIDELTPDGGNRRLENGAPFFTIGRFEGVFVGFQSMLIERIDYEGYGALRVAFPDLIYYLQRRNSFRVTVAPGDLSTVDLQRRGAKPLYGQGHDLSVNGMRLLVPSALDYALTTGEYIPLVRFSLEDAELAVEAEVRFVGSLRDTKTRQPMRQLGIQFLNMAPAFEQRLQHYVQRRDRELLRDARR
jgi:c-di-GMP-binding flagellar brake protein YcgR